MTKLRGARIVALIVLTMTIANVSAASGAVKTDEGGEYTDLTYYNQVPYTVRWTDVYRGYYTTDYQNNKYVQGQNQGGCLNNISAGFSQAVSGNVTYYWPGGSQGPVQSTTQNPITVICESGSGRWGSGDTSNNPVVIFLVYDPPGTDYVRIFSHWTCTSCIPNYFSRTRYGYWN